MKPETVEPSANDNERRLAETRKTLADRALTISLQQIEKQGIDELARLLYFFHTEPQPPADASWNRVAAPIRRKWLDLAKAGFAHLGPSGLPLHGPRAVVLLRNVTPSPIERLRNGMRPLGTPSGLVARGTARPRGKAPEALRPLEEIGFFAAAGLVGRRSTALHLHYLLRSRRDAARAARLACSGLFDAAYYLDRYGDVAREGVDPLLHYLDFGVDEHRSPSAAMRVLDHLDTIRVRDPMIRGLMELVRGKPTD